MGCGCNRSMSGGGKRKRQQSKQRKQSRKTNRSSRRKSTKQQKKRNYKKRSIRHRKMRRMSGGSGLMDPITSGLHDATTKLTSNPYIPSNAHIQPAGQPYQDDRNPYYV